MQPELLTEPQKHPQVTIAGKTYDFRYSCGALVRLKKEHGHELKDFVKLDEHGKPLVREFSELNEEVCILMHAALARVSGMTYDQLSEALDPSDLNVYMVAIAEAIKKVSPQATEPKATEPAPLVN